MSSLRASYAGIGNVSPEEFSSNTHMNKLTNVFRITKATGMKVFYQGDQDPNTMLMALVSF